ncbi:HIT family hydrolase [Halobacteriales archaeon SW_7_68_16]|nr:MAG: HIT family hydrolase [Halobacteriales archaeon SW_7_68_16]
MDQVFAPWRIDWVEREDRNEEIDGCVFCTLVDRERATEDRVVVASETAFVLLNNYPYNPGHAMVIPRTHTGDVRDLDDETLLGHGRLLQRTIDAVETAMEPDGYNVGLNLGRGAGGSVKEHLHTHVVPRWREDTNFMPVVADTSVIVEAVDASYDRLRAAFATQDGTTDPGPDRPIRIET